MLNNVELRGERPWRKEKEFCWEPVDWLAVIVYANY
jgi:hypothetical protein